MHPYREPALRRRVHRASAGKRWGAAPMAPFLLVPPLTAPSLLYGLQTWQADSLRSNILLTKRKRKYVRLLLSSGVGGCYRTRWLKLVFHLPGWWENTAWFNDLNDGGCLASRWLAVISRGSCSFRLQKDPRVQFWGPSPTVSGVGGRSNVFRSLPWWCPQESFAVVFKHGPRPQHQYHLTYWIRNSVGMGSNNLCFISQPDNSDAHLSLWIIGLEKGVGVVGARRRGKWWKMSHIRFKLRTIRYTLVSQIYSGLFHLFATDVSSGKKHHLSPSHFNLFLISNF